MRKKGDKVCPEWVTSFSNDNKKSIEAKQCLDFIDALELYFTGASYDSKEYNSEPEEHDSIEPKHYLSEIFDGAELKDIMVETHGVMETKTFFKLSAFKYRLRAGKKPNQDIKQDIEKALRCEMIATELKGKIHE